MYGKYYLPAPVCNTTCTLNLFFFHVLKTLPFHMIFPPPSLSSSLFLILCVATLVTNTMVFLYSQNHDTISSSLKLKKKFWLSLQLHMCLFFHKLKLSKSVHSFLIFLHLEKSYNKHSQMRVQFLDWEDPLEKEMATHSTILTWEILWTGEPGGLQSMGSQRVGLT